MNQIELRTCQAIWCPLCCWKLLKMSWTWDRWCYTTRSHGVLFNKLYCYISIRYSFLNNSTPSFFCMHHVFPLLLFSMFWWIVLCDNLFLSAFFGTITMCYDMNSIHDDKVYQYIFSSAVGPDIIAACARSSTYLFLLLPEWIVLQFPQIWMTMI